MNAIAPNNIEKNLIDPSNLVEKMGFKGIGSF